MRTISRWIAPLAAVAVLGFFMPVLAQHHGGRHGEGPGGCHNAAVQTLKGSVTAIDMETCPNCGYKNVTLTVDVNGKATKVLIGPKSYLEENDFAINNGDMVEVTAVASHGHHAAKLVARTLAKGGQTITLRDEQCMPRWKTGSCQCTE